MNAAIFSAFFIIFLIFKNVQALVFCSFKISRLFFMTDLLNTLLNVQIVLSSISRLFLEIKKNVSNKSYVVSRRAPPAFYFLTDRSFV